MLLADFAMPSMNGEELAEEVRRALPNLPVLFISGYIDPAHMDNWTARGWQTLRKPFNLRGLAAAIRKAMQTTAG